MSPEVADRFREAIEANDLESTAELAGEIEQIDSGLFNWGMPPLAASRSSEMVDLLIARGAGLEQVSEWWRSGFGAHEVNPDTARYLFELGASVSPHAAAAIGLVEELENLLADDPDLVGAPGGDGASPLHFARSPEIAKLLVEGGADPDARDDDHGSTPAQWRIKDSPEVVRYLVRSSASPDIFLAAALGDLEMAEALIATDPGCTAMRIGYNNGPFPGIGHQGRGGTIYQWTLGFNLSPHEVALKNQLVQLHDLLLEHTPRRQQLLVACTTANRALAEEIAASDPTLVEQLDPDEQTLLAKYCWETNIDREAVRLMLDLGFPVDIPENNHGFTALHNAAWCGDPDLVSLLLQHGHPTGWRDPQFNATAIGFAIHSCTQAKRHPEGKFHDVLRILIDAGVPGDEQGAPINHDDIDRLLDQK